MQYLRMSSEHQRYSLENQAVAIAAYALERDYDIRHTYADPGKRGLTLKGRPGLAQLLADVIAPGRDFAAVLVLDISRWGRFQDPDQAAHYEFLRKQAGVQVIYCAEPFENDGRMVSLIQEPEAADGGRYVRELSTKVSRAHVQQAQLGFHQGGVCRYGVRRLLINSHRKPRQVLEDGVQKAASTDRAVLVPGPPLRSPWSGASSGASWSVGEAPAPFPENSRSRNSSVRRPPLDRIPRSRNPQERVDDRPLRLQ